MKRKLFVAGGYGYGYARPYNNIDLTQDISEADIVLFTGGADISPSIYGEEPISGTYTNPQRDRDEIAAYRQMRPDQLALGICRGAQLLCALNGGKIIQDVSGHSIWGTHPIEDRVNHNRYEMTSIHHQMMYPYNLNPNDYTIKFVSAPARSHYYAGGGFNSEAVVEHGEPEIIIFHKEGTPTALAIQGHPEAMSPTSPTVIMINKMIDDILKNDSSYGTKN